ncbi:MAG: nuclear transport factor 2 family protein [Tepidiformaceae bacterium]
MTVEELLAQQEIRDVLAAYCRAIDRMDAELLASVYHPDATDDHGAYKGLAAGFVDWVMPILARFDSTTHFSGNSLIRVDGDVAHSESYTIAYHRRDRSGGGKEDWILAVRYVDRFELRQGAWKIARRVCVFDWQRIDAVGEGSALGRDWAVGHRDRLDPVYRQ